MKKLQLAVVGAGLVGKRHIASILQSEDAELSAIVDSDEQIRAYATEVDVPWYSSLTDLFANQKPDGVVLATPNQLHVEQGLECVAAKCPMLVEKPLAVSSDDAAELVEEARREQIPILVGHHRRHNPLMQKAREIVETGQLGQLRAVHATCWLFKPDDYFERAPWRKKAGAGPVSVNLVHDIDLIRYLCGDVLSIQAQAAPSVRGFENEDVAAALLRFENGAVGTITVSDTVVAPWSWELTARENPAYPPTSQSCYLLGGTHGSLSLPDLTLWQNGDTRSWWEPIGAVTLPRESSDPLTNQIEHFIEVIRGEAQPLVSGYEGLKTLRVIEGIHRAAQTGEIVKP